MSRLDREREFFNRLVHGADVRRNITSRTYWLSLLAGARFLETVRSVCRDQDVLDYGCGRGEVALDLVEHGARSVTGIDIAEESVRHARERAGGLGSTQLRFEVMDATSTDFEPGRFDLIVGKSILHHLDVGAALGELARILRPGGMVMLLEPLGHNPAIRLFRRITPSLRTADERPLRSRDLRLCAQFFSQVDLYYFNLLTLPTLLIPRRVPGYFRALRILDWCDRRLLAALPPLGRFAWNVVIVMTEPRRGSRGAGA